jgi:hypothetical protein
MVIMYYPWVTFVNNWELRYLLRLRPLKCRCGAHYRRKLDVNFKSLPFRTRFLGGIQREIDSNNALY